MFSLKKIDQTAERLYSQFYWTNTYGVARSILALGTLLTLLTNNIHELLAPLPSNGQIGEYRSLAEYSLYQLLPNQVNLVYGFSILVLILVVIGWRPRITGIFHWWVSFSYVNSSMIIDGGDQIVALLCLLIIPICLADPRKWHWTNDSSTQPKNYYQKATALLVISCFFIIQLQVAFIYFHAGIGKLNVEEWINGTAIYYWFNHPNFGLSPFIKPLFDPIINSAFTVTLLTWAVILLELLLFLGLAISDKWRPTLLKLGVLFHFMIIVVHGLVSFFFAMLGALILYLGPVKKGFNLPVLKNPFPQKSILQKPLFNLKLTSNFFQKTFDKIVKS